MEDHERLADDLEREVGQMQDESERVSEHIEDTRDDWERKRRADQVPGAEPPGEDEDEDAPEGYRGHDESSVPEDSERAD